MNQSTDGQNAEYREIFKVFDANDDGVISVVELKEILETYGIRASPQDLREMMEELDPTNDDVIDFEGFLLIMNNPIFNCEQEFEETFKLFDKNGDGKISAVELKDVMANFGEGLTDKEIEEIFSEMDLDGDGQINYKDFVKMMKGR